MDLFHYLERIRFDGDPRPDLETLRAVHHLHLRHIPYENLDVQLGRPLSLDCEAIYRKIVIDGRGGWCYEMNGLLAWALEQLQFRLTRIAAGVQRAVRGDAMLGNHLALVVHLEEGDYLADVGFGDGLVEPVPLAEGSISQGCFRYRLESLSRTWWRFHSHDDSSAATFDFEHAPADRSLLERQNRWLQTSEQSPFVQNAVCQSINHDGLVSLRGRVRVESQGRGLSKSLIENEREYEAVLSEEFGLRLKGSEIAEVWRRIVARHTELFASERSRG